jgi:hypothetical protein
LVLPSFVLQKVIAEHKAEVKTLKAELQKLKLSSAKSNSNLKKKGKVPTQFKATQLVVAIAVWANAISARGARPDLSIPLLNNASEQCYITIG